MDPRVSPAIASLANAANRDTLLGRQFVKFLVQPAWQTVHVPLSSSQRLEAAGMISAVFHYVPDMVIALHIRLHLHLQLY